MDKVHYWVRIHHVRQRFSGPEVFVMARWQRMATGEDREKLIFSVGEAGPEKSWQEKAALTTWVRFAEIAAMQTAGTVEIVRVNLRAEAEVCNCPAGWRVRELSRRPHLPQGSKTIHQGLSYGVTRAFIESLMIPKLGSTRRYWLASDQWASGFDGPWLTVQICKSHCGTDIDCIPYFSDSSWSFFPKIAGHPPAATIKRECPGKVPAIPTLLQMR